MQRIIGTLLSLTCGLFLFQAKAAYYDTLPAGVRALEYRYITTDQIDSAFNVTRTESDYNFKLNMDAKSLAELNNETKEIFNYVRGISEEAYNNFSFGEYEIDGKAQVTVQVVGLAWGLRKDTYAYFGIPIYHGRVELDIVRTKGNNHAEVASALQSSGSGAEAQIFTQFASQLPDANGELLQSAVVNYLGYKPIGNWEATDLGDVEVGVVHRLTDWDFAGLAVTGGLVLPTGRQDDPDIIQDIPFGDGQTDVFGEFGGGMTLRHTIFSWDSFIRYTYQLPSTKTLRVPDNPNYKEISTEKAEFKEKLGDIFDFNYQLNATLTNWMGLWTGYQYRNQMESKYDSPNERANKILAADTSSEAHFAKLGANFSTVSLFKSGKFLLPMNANISGSKVIAGRNHPNYTRYDLQLRFFF